MIFQPRFNWNLFIPIMLGAAAASVLSLNVIRLSSEAQESGQAKFPGIFISDTKGLWQLPSDKIGDGTQYGFVICHGGYLGSPLIPNDKSIVDQYLSLCNDHIKRGVGNIPIIDVPANYSAKAGYPAYKAEINGRTYFLCRGFLNSTNWCSYSGEQQALKIVSKLKKNESIDEEVEAMREGHQNGRKMLGESSIQEKPRRKELVMKQDKGIEEESDTKNAINFEAINDEISYRKQEPRFEARRIERNEVQEQPRVENDYREAPQRSDAVEIAQELAKLLGSEKNNSKTVEITKKELNALNDGSINLDELINSRQITSLASARNSESLMALKKIPLNGGSEDGGSVKVISPQIKTIDSVSAIGGGSANVKTLAVTESEYKALQSGALKLEDIIQRQQQAPLPSSAQSNGQTLAVTQSEFEAIQSGRIKIEDLLNRQTAPQASPAGGPQTLAITQSEFQAIQAGTLRLEDVMNRQNLPTVSNPSMAPDKRTVAITESEMAAIQSGSATLEQILQSRPEIPVAQNPTPPIMETNPNFAQPQLMQGQPQPPLAALPNPTDELYRANPQMEAFNGGNPAQQFMTQLTPGQTFVNGAPPINAPTRNGPQPLNLTYVDDTSTPYEQSPYPLQWSGYYLNNYYNMSPPLSYATTAIYGTHSNTIYWPGMAVPMR